VSPGRKKTSKGGRPRPKPAQGSAARGYMVPGMVLVAVVVALVAIGLSGERPTDPLPVPEQPTPPEQAIETDPELAALRAEAITILQRVVDRWTRDPAEPWLVMHGLLAWGPRHLTHDGDPAGVYLLDHKLETHELAGRPVQVFPMDDPGGARIDAHPNQSIKTMIEMGIGDDRIDSIVADAQWRFEYDADDPENPFPDANDVPWSAQAFCQTAHQGDDSFTTHDGTVVDLRVMTRQLVEALERESEFLDEIRLAGDTTYEKRRQGIFRYTCGGTHLFMGADACVTAGFGDQELSERLAYQMDLLFWRMRREIDVVNQALTDAPQMAPLLVEQRMKYLGHFLETAAKAEMNGTYTPTMAHRQEIEYAERVLYITVKQLQDMGVFDRLDTFHESQYEYYLYTAGDACHALHALNLQDQLAAQRGGQDYALPAPVYGGEDPVNSASMGDTSPDSP
jgi:hypothetical protein